MRFGLLASSLCASMAEVAETDTERLHAMAEHFEGKATGVLDHLPSGVALGALPGARSPPSRRDADLTADLLAAVCLSLPGSVGVRHLARPDRVWGLSLLEFGYTAEMKAFLGHSHCRGLVRTLLHQTPQLAMPHHTTALAIFTQVRKTGCTRDPMLIAT